MSSGSDVEMSEEPVKALAYDPEQNPEERRKIRKGYRALGKKLEGRIPLSFHWKDPWLSKYRTTGQH